MVFASTLNRQSGKLQAAYLQVNLWTCRIHAVAQNHLFAKNNLQL